MFDIKYPDDFWTCDTLFKNLDKLILIVIVMRNYFCLDRSQEEKNRNVNRWDEECDDENCVFVGWDEENGCYENYKIFIDGQYVVPNNEHLLIVLN